MHLTRMIEKDQILTNIIRAFWGGLMALSILWLAADPGVLARQGFLDGAASWFNTAACWQ